MRKYLYLLIALLMVLAVFPAPVVAQDGEDEVDVVQDLVMPRLMEYSENLPEGYGVVKIDAFLEMLFEEEEEFIILDVREETEIEENGIIEGAIHIPLRTLGENLDLLPDQEAMIIVVCKGGFRGTIAMTALHVLGYENAKVLAGGFDAWVGEDMPVVDEPAEVEAAEVPEDIDPLLLEYVAEYLTNLPEGWQAITADKLAEELVDSPPDFLIDVRSEEEWMDPGYIEGAQHIWIDEFIMRMDEWPEDLEANIVVYCASSYRGGIAMVMMNLLGYTNVRNLAGGINAWVKAEYPVVVPEAQ